MQVRRPPSGINTLAVTLSNRSKKNPEHKQTIDDTIAIAVDMIALFRREKSWFSWKYSVLTSWKVMVEVNAARAINRKNIADHISGIVISLNTNGRVSNMSVGPWVGSKPSTLKTAGKIIIPDNTATKKVSIEDDHAVVERFVPSLKYEEQVIKHPKPIDSEKNAWPIALTTVFTVKAFEKSGLKKNS